MKKLLCLMLVLGMLLAAAPAMADMSLYDIWEELTWAVPDHSSKKKLSSTNNDRWVDGFRVGEVSNSMMQSAFGTRSGGTAEELLAAWHSQSYYLDQPFLEIMVTDLAHVDMEIESSEFYSFYKGREEVAIAEFYSVDIDFETPYGNEPYGLIFCVSMDRFGEQSAQYIVTFGDLGALGNVSGASTGNYLGDMYVVNCEEWVSLRAMPSTKSERMRKVPLYADVENCFDAGNGFVFCEYDGAAGFILEEYLVPASY